MFKTKYRFNPDTLSYDRIQLSFRERFTRFTLLAFGFVLFAFSIGTGVSVYFFNATDYLTIQREKQLLVGKYEELNNKVQQMSALLVNISERDDNLYRLMLNSEPIPQSVRNMGVGGTDRYRDLQGHEFSDLIIGTSQRIDELARKMIVQAKSYDEVVQMAQEHEQMLKAIPAIRPVAEGTSRITSLFGYRVHPILHITRMHEGVDFAAPRGSKVYATADGVVEQAKYNGGYGRQVVINHGFGYKTSYSHLYAMDVKAGQTIKRGDVIGAVGTSGLSTSTHLHYEVFLNGKNVDPISYFFGDIKTEDLIHSDEFME